MKINDKKYELFKGNNLDCADCCFQDNLDLCEQQGQKFCNRHQVWKVQEPANYLPFLSDEMYTPISYKGRVIKEPFFEGCGNHSVAALETICMQFTEYCHQQAIIKQNCMKHIIELKFGIKLPID